MKLKQYYCSLDQLIDGDGKPKKQIKAETDKKGRKFRNILEELGLGKEVGWYKSEKSSSNRGYFIFEGTIEDKVSEELNELFDIFRKRKGFVSFKNANRIIEILYNLLPVIKDENRIDELLDDYRYGFKSFVRLLDEMKGLEIFKQNSFDKAKKKELDEIERMLKKIETFKVVSESRKTLDFTKESQIDKEKKDVITETVYNFFLSRMNGMYFRDTIYVGKNDSEYNESNKDFFTKQYSLVKIWYVKWIYIIDHVDELRKAEDLYNAIELFKHYKLSPDNIEKFLQDKEVIDACRKCIKIGIGEFANYFQKVIKEEKNETLKKMLEDRNLKKEIKNKSSCCDFCMNLVEEFSIHETKGIDKLLLRDIRIWAFKELEELSCKLWDYNVMEKELEKEKSIVNEEHESMKDMYLNYYYTYGRNMNLDTECLESILDIKYGKPRVFIEEGLFVKSSIEELFNR